MFWLRNELFGFPVNDCDYESISCERSYIPVLNWDKENEFTWSLADPYGTDIDANNVSFNTRSAAWPSDTTSVARALEELMRRVNESNKCKFDITGFTLLPDDQGNVVGTISYNDTKGNPHTVEASFNLKEAIESMDLNLSNLTVDNLTVNTRLDSLGETATHGIENDGDITNTGDMENMGKITTENFEANTAKVTTKLESLGETVTNGIENDGDITNTGEVATNSLVSQTGAIGDLTSDRVVVTTTLESIGETITRGIDNTGDITNSGKITTNDIETNTAKVNTKLESLGETITNGIENTGVIDTETLTVAGDAEFGGNVSIDGDTTMNNIHAEWNLEVDGKTLTNGIDNTGDIKNTGLLQTNDAKIDNNLIVDGHTDLQTLEVNGAAAFREPVNVYDDFYVSGDYTLNGEGKFNGPETHNGDIVYNGDVVFNGSLTADDINIDLSDYQEKSDKGRVNGYASLDDQGKVPMSQLPNIAGGITYKGGWNAWTGVYPSNPSNGDMYYCTNGGTVNGTVYNRWDRIIYDSDTASWNVLPDNYWVQSVNGRTGVVVDVQDTTDRKNVIDLVNPATNKYLSEKAVVDLVNPLIQRIEELEQENAKTNVIDLSADLPSTMTEGTSYTVAITSMTADTNIVVGNTNTNGNIVVTPGNGFVTVVSSADETNPVINILTFKA